MNRSENWTVDKDDLFEPSTGEDSADGGLYKHPAHEHKLKKTTRDSGWNCDGGCGHNSGSAPVPLARYRCTGGCDYDLCINCMGSLVDRCPPNMTTDGTFLYLTRSDGVSIAKIGSGLRGSVRGLCYARRKGGCTRMLCPAPGPPRLS